MGNLGPDNNRADFGPSTEYPFDPWPTTLIEERSPGSAWISWLPLIVVFSVFTVTGLVVAALLVVRSGSDEEAVSENRSTSAPDVSSPATPDQDELAPTSPSLSDAGTQPSAVSDPDSDTSSGAENTTSTAPPAQTGGAQYPNPTAGSGPAGSGCSPGSGQLPDGVWFGRIQRMADAPNGSFWEDDQIEFRLYCLYGGQAAVDLAASRFDAMQPDTNFYAIKDEPGRRTISRAPNATARDLMNLTGATGPAVPWEEAPNHLGPIAGSGCCNEGWLRIEGGQVTEFAVRELETGISHSFPRPVGTTCRDNGLVAPVRLEVDDLSPSVQADDGIKLYEDPGFGSRLVGTAALDTILFVIHRCEIAADGHRWWMLDWEGRLVWGPSEFLRTYDGG